MSTIPGDKFAQRKSFDYYYQEELAYMREMGRVFSNEYPKLAPFLARQGNDPDVERLLEGFSFIASRIRQRIDGSLSELAQDINHLMWPQLQRPIPSFSIVKFTPPENNISSCKIIERHSEVSSIPVQGTECVFSTCYEVKLFPLSIHNTVINDHGETSSIDILMRMNECASLNDINLDTIRIFINGDTLSSSKLYRLILSQIKNVRVSLASESSDVSAELASDSIRPVGFTPDTSILPQAENVVDAHQQIVEYFCYPEKYFFFDIVIDDQLPRDRKFETITIKLVQDKSNKSIDRIENTTFLLYCTPVVNIFGMDAEPIRHPGHKLEHLVRPAIRNKQHYSVYSIETVMAYYDGGKLLRRLSELNSVSSNNFYQSHNEQPDDFYRVKNQPSVTGGVDVYISFCSGIEKDSLKQSTISMRLACTNNNLPEKLKINDIHLSGDGVPATIKVTNINVPTRSFVQQIDGDSQWQMLSNYSTNYVNLANAKNLKRVLASFHIPSQIDRQAARELERKLDSIVKVEMITHIKLIDGSPVHGYKIMCDVRGDSYSNEGEMYLFYTVIHHYFSVLADINTFSTLEVNDIDRCEKYFWDSKING